MGYLARRHWLQRFSHHFSNALWENKTVLITFELVVFGVGGKQDVREELVEAVAGVPRPVLHVGPHRLVELHQELLRRRPELLDHLVPLVDIFREQR